MGRRLSKKRRKVTLAEMPRSDDPPMVIGNRLPSLLRNAQVVQVEVDNPEPEAPGDKILAFKSTRGDPLERLRQQSDIDEAQYQAGKAYERDLELAEVGNVKAIDPTKEAVDGGKLAEPLSDLQRRALMRLREAGAVMGLFAESIVRGVLERNMSPAQLAISRGFSTRREQLHYGWIFRRALEELTGVYGTALQKA